MIRTVSRDNVLVESWDSTSGLYQRFAADGAVVQSRPLTAAEAAELAEAEIAEVEAVNGRTLEERLRRHLTANTAYLALADPTAAQQRAQVARLTRAVSALTRLALRDLRDVGGTE